MLSNLLTFIFFIVVGLEIREGLSKPKEVLLPALCALGGMVVPALIFIAFHTHTDLWAVAMPTDVALAIGALIFLGKRVNPRVRLFLLTLAVADDLFSLLVIAIFFRRPAPSLECDLHTRCCADWRELALAVGAYSLPIPRDHFRRNSSLYSD